jgi:hypothetical protein
LARDADEGSDTEDDDEDGGEDEDDGSMRHMGDRREAESSEDEEEEEQEVNMFGALRSREEADDHWPAVRAAADAAAGCFAPPGLKQELRQRAGAGAHPLPPAVGAAAEAQARRRGWPEACRPRHRRLAAVRGSKKNFAMRQLHPFLYFSLLLRIIFDLLCCGVSMNKNLLVAIGLLVQEYCHNVLMDFAPFFLCASF